MAYQFDTPTPETKALLEKVASANVPPLESLSVEEARAQFRFRAAAMSFPLQEVGQVRDFELPLPGRNLQARAYWPEPRAASFPLVVYFHGGGMVIGDLETHDPICRRISLEAAAVVVAVEYRKAPEFPFPCAVRDAIEAFRYLAGDWPEPGIDRSNLFVAGDSAGGTLAAVVAQEWARNKFAALSGQILIYPALDHTTISLSRHYLRSQFPITRDAISWYEGQYFSDEEQKHSVLASPALARDLDGFPPALVMTAGLDPLRDEGEIYAGRLAQAAPLSRHVHYPGILHGFLGMGSLIPEAADAVREIAEFSRKASS